MWEYGWTVRSRARGLLRVLWLPAGSRPSYHTCLPIFNLITLYRGSNVKNYLKATISLSKDDVEGGKAMEAMRRELLGYIEQGWQQY